MAVGTFDYDECVQVLFEVIEEMGDLVIRNDWDTNSMGAGSGSESVFRFRDLYWGISADMGKSGPFKTLAGALDETRAHVMTSAVVSVDCEEEVVGMLDLDNLSDDDVLELNGKQWKVATSGRAQKLVPVKQRRKR